MWSEREREREREDERWLGERQTGRETSVLVLCKQREREKEADRPRADKTQRQTGGQANHKSITPSSS